MAANQLKSDFGMDVVMTLCEAIIKHNLRSKSDNYD
nr:MAG TPA: hypothetical protein [Caudoviricetes sp.]